MLCTVRGIPGLHGGLALTPVAVRACRPGPGRLLEQPAVGGAAVVDLLLKDKNVIDSVTMVEHQSLATAHALMHFMARAVSTVSNPTRGFTISIDDFIRFLMSERRK